MAIMTTERITRPRRRYLRFTLRGLLVFILVLGASIGMMVRSARVQREAVTAIEKSGGTAHYNWTFTNRAFIQGGKPWAPSRLIDLFGIDYFGHVTYVRLRTTTDDLLAHVARLDRVQHLSISDDSDINAGLAHLSGLTGLTELTLLFAPVSGAGLAHLKRLTRLSKLERLTKLSRLVVRDAPINDSSLAHLDNLRNLSLLILRDSAEIAREPA